MSKFVDLTGQKFGRLTVIKRAPNKGAQTTWVCCCDCGNNIIAVQASHLKNGTTKSCGCLKRDSNIIHGHCGERVYNIWAKMKSRCYNPNDPKYYRYGSRKIKVCEEWLNNFQAFYDWAMNNGYSDELSINRKNNDGNYCPENCEWATDDEQANNKSTSHFITYSGKTQTIAQWANEYEIDYDILWSRLDRGWTIEKALKQKENPKYRYIEYKGKKQTMAGWAKEYNIDYDKLRQRINKLHWNIEKALNTP